MFNKKIKSILVLVGLIFSSVLCMAAFTICPDGYSHIELQESKVQHPPKTSSINASINGHTLTVTFLENLGDVQIEITTATGGTVDYGHIWTPDSYIAYITNTGDYIVTITLGNGDEYYGEFEVTD